MYLLERWSVLCGAMHSSIDCIYIIIIITFIHTVQCINMLIYTFARQNLQTMCGCQWVQGGELGCWLCNSGTHHSFQCIVSLFHQALRLRMSCRPLTSCTAPGQVARTSSIRWFTNSIPLSLYRIVGRPNIGKTHFSRAFATSWQSSVVVDMLNWTLTNGQQYARSTYCHHEANASCQSDQSVKKKFGQKNILTCTYEKNSFATIGLSGGLVFWGTRRLQVLHSLMKCSTTLLGTCEYKDWT